MGNYIILDITIQNQRLSFACIYGPNADNPVFFNKLKHDIEFFDNNSVLVTGDFNTVMSYQKDTHKYARENNKNSRLAILNMMEELDLMDIWRFQHQDTNRYIWFGPGGKCSQLDYFLISTDLESFVTTSDITFKYKSDHTPIILKLRFYNQEKGRGTWKYNNSLLFDQIYTDSIKNIIREVLIQYSTEEEIVDDNYSNLSFTINDQLLWEMLKLKIRGKTISYSSWKKKQ